MVFLRSTYLSTNKDFFKKISPKIECTYLQFVLEISHILNLLFPLPPSGMQYHQSMAADLSDWPRASFHPHTRHARHSSGIRWLWSPLIRSGPTRSHTTRLLKRREKSWSHFPMGKLEGRLLNTNIVLVKHLYFFEVSFF